MIYLGKLKIIFIKPTRVAGSSFEVCLSSFADKLDIITPIKREEIRKKLGYKSPQNFNYSIIETFKLSKILFLKSILKKKLPRKFYNHMPASEIKNKLGEKIWDESLKISIIRNPFDQIISYYYRTIKKTGININFEEWIKRNPSIIIQNKQHYNINNKPIIDFFIRYESFEKDIKTLEYKIPELVGLYDKFKNTLAPAYPGSRPENIDIKDFYEKNSNVKKLIEIFHSEELDKFNYHL